MNKNRLFSTVLAIMICAAFLFVSGCSSDSGGGGVSYNPQDFDFNYPSPTTPQTSTSTASAKGFVYYTGSAKATGNAGIFFSPVQLNGYTPATGALITLPTNPPMTTKANSLGFFDFNLPDDYFANLRINLLIEFLNYMLMQPIMPVKPIDSISAPRIMSSNSNGRDMTLATANSSTTLMLTDLFGNQVAEPVSWVLSSSSMGTLNGSVFTAGTTAMQGTISAIVNGKTVAQQNVTIVAATASFFGNVKYSNGQNAADLVITIKGWGINYSSFGITDASGNYRIENVPDGYNYNLEIADKAGNAMLYTRANSNPNPPHDLIVSQSVPQTATLMLKTVTDKLSYKPGETMQVAVEISNMSSNSIQIANRNVTYTLVEEDFWTGQSTVLSTASGTTGTLSVPANSSSKSGPVSLLIPPTVSSPMLKSHIIKADVNGMTFRFKFETSVIISADLVPGAGGGTPTNPPTNDSDILANANSLLVDAYFTLNDATNEADSSGADVSEDVNSSSMVVFRLNLVRNTILTNYSNTSLKNSWQSKIDSIKHNLSRYVDTKDVSYLRTARASLSSLRSEVKFQKDSI